MRVASNSEFLQRKETILSTFEDVICSFDLPILKALLNNKEQLSDKLDFDIFQNCKNDNHLHFMLFNRPYYNILEWLSKNKLDTTLDEQFKRIKDIYVTDKEYTVLEGFHILETLMKAPKICNSIYIALAYDDPKKDIKRAIIEELFTLKPDPKLFQVKPPVPVNIVEFKDFLKDMDGIEWTSFLTSNVAMMELVLQEKISIGKSFMIMKHGYNLEYIPELNDYFLKGTILNHVIENEIEFGQIEVFKYDPGLND